MELLQSATISGTANPANDQLYWNESSYGNADFVESWSRYVYPNTTYNLHSITWMVVFPPPLYMQTEVQPCSGSGMDSDYRNESAYRGAVIGLNGHSNSQLVRQQIR